MTSYEELNFIFETFRQSVKELVSFEDQQKIYKRHLELIDKITEEQMDKKIKSAKKSMDKKMDSLLKADKKHDKKCEHDEMMAKKAKKK